jgi:multidrug efflux pump subunit AcrA (membrane-fusion protein)
VNSRLAIPMVACALLMGPLAVAAAQDTSAASVPPTQDSTPQGYAPAEPAPAPAVAPAPAPAAQPAPTPAAAAAPAPAPAAPNRAAVLSRLGFVEILSPRSPDRLRRGIEEARTDQREAEAEYSQQEALEDQVKAMVEVKKQEVSTLDAQRKLAEKSKQEGEVATFEAEKKDAERHKQFLERRVSLHQAEKDAARARKNLAESTQKALELELQLANRRADRDRTATTDAAATMRHENVIRDLERKVLEAQRAEADREKQVADKHQDIAKRRLELYQAQVTAGGDR